jgi:hypothetical protein
MQLDDYWDVFATVEEAKKFFDRVGNSSKEH